MEIRTEEKQSPKHLIYLNQLRNLRNGEQQKTDATINLLLKSVENRITAERMLTDTLAGTQVALAASQEEANYLRTQITTLLTSQSMFDTSTLMKKQITEATNTNKMLKISQYHTSLADASLQIEQLKRQLSKQKTLDEMNQARTAAELRLLRPRVEQLQETARNVTNALVAGNRQEKKEKNELPEADTAKGKKDKKDKKGSDTKTRASRKKPDGEEGAAKRRKKKGGNELDQPPDADQQFLSQASFTPPPTGNTANASASSASGEAPLPADNASASSASGEVPLPADNASASSASGEAPLPADNVSASASESPE